MFILDVHKCFYKDTISTKLLEELSSLDKKDEKKRKIIFC